MIKLYGVTVDENELTKNKLNQKFFGNIFTADCRWHKVAKTTKNKNTIF